MKQVKITKSVAGVINKGKSCHFWANHEYEVDERAYDALIALKAIKVEENKALKAAPENKAITSVEKKKK